MIKKNVSLEQINKQLMPISKEIESKMLELESKYGFRIDYSFKEITVEDLRNFTE